MSLVVIETIGDSPSTSEALAKANAQVSSCLQEQKTGRRYSLLSIKHYRKLCAFEASATVCRRTHHKANVQFSNLWSVDAIYLEGILPTQNKLNLNVFEVISLNSFTDEEWNTAYLVMLPCYEAPRSIELQLYMLLGRTRVVCELKAIDAAVIRAADRRVGIPLIKSGMSRFYSLTSSPERL